MKQTLKKQALIYSAAYLISSFIAWDLTWLPCRVYNIAANMDTMSIGWRSIVLMYVAFTVIGAFALHKRKCVEAPKKDDYEIIAACCYFGMFSILVGVAIIN